MDGWQTLSFVHLGASVEELAKETIESILGYDGKSGHKPARPDIQKYKDAYKVFKQRMPEAGEIDNDPEGEQIQAARDEWDNNYMLNEKELAAVRLYRQVLDNRSGDFYNDPQKAFDFVARMWSMPGGFGEEGQGNAHPDDPPGPEAKKFVGTALKKFEQQHYPMLYEIIKNALDDAYRRGPLESYKLWPRLVTWIKDWYQQSLTMGGTEPNRFTNHWAPMPGAVTHMLDVILPAGKQIDELRRENRLPQNFDVNKVSFPELEEWYMQWKRENLGSEHVGQVVYQFHDGWTIQKLTTPEQLQFEGDEMGHCVGGYAHSVGEGQIIIYSLRDPKGMPHVTMEVRAVRGYPADIQEQEQGRRHRTGGGEWLHPDRHEPGQHLMDNGVDENHHTKWEKPDTFEVVQVQGNSNNTPKPEYQRKIKEFLDALRKKGWKFVRADDWFHNFDDPRQRDYGGFSDTAENLEEWYEEHYKPNYKQYQSGQEDPYGLAGDRITMDIRWDEMFEDVLRSLYNDYDRSQWSGWRWDQAARAVYHAFMVDVYKDHLDKQQLEQHEANLKEHIQKAEEQIMEYNQQNSEYAWEYIQPEIFDHAEKMLQQQGLYDQVYEKAELEHEEDPHTDLETLMANIIQEEHDDLWMEATWAAEAEYNDGITGDAQKFLNYLYNLADHEGAVNPHELPDPNQRNGGLPSYEELMERNQHRIDLQQSTPTLELPGAMSAWRPMEVASSDS